MASECSSSLPVAAQNTELKTQSSKLKTACECNLENWQIYKRTLAVRIINARSQQKRLRWQLTLINTQNMQLDYYAFNYAMLCVASDDCCRALAFKAICALHSIYSIYGTTKVKLNGPNPSRTRKGFYGLLFLDSCLISLGSMNGKFYDLIFIFAWLLIIVSGNFQKYLET